MRRCKIMKKQYLVVMIGMKAELLAGRCVAFGSGRSTWECASSASVEDARSDP